MFSRNPSADQNVHSLDLLQSDFSFRFFAGCFVHDAVCTFPDLRNITVQVHCIGRHRPTFHLFDSTWRWSEGCSHCWVTQNNSLNDFYRISRWNKLNARLGIPLPATNIAPLHTLWPGWIPPVLEWTHPQATLRMDRIFMNSFIQIQCEIFILSMIRNCTSAVSINIWR